MADKMRAIAKTAPGPGAECIELPIPEITEDEVLIKVVYGAICGTDIHRYVWNDSAKNDPRSKDRFPRILGHEFAGEIVQVGNRVRGWKTGDRVTAETHVPCGQCHLCRTGNSYNCLNLHGFKNGVFAEYAVVDAASLVRIPDTISYREAATFEPFTVGVHAIESTEVFGRTVLVTGAGPIGLYVMKLAMLNGARQVIVTDLSEYRRELARKLGADYVLDAADNDLENKIRDLTDHMGAEIVAECSGANMAMRLALDTICKCGTLLMLGMTSEPLTVDVNRDIITKGTVIKGIYGRRIFDNWETTLNLTGSGKVELSEFITHEFSMFEEFKQAFELAAGGKSGKIVLFTT